jgi:hypothetical protein
MSVAGERYYFGSFRHCRVGFDFFQLMKQAVYSRKRILAWTLWSRRGVVIEARAI